MSDLFDLFGQLANKRNPPSGDAWREDTQNLCRNLATGKVWAGRYKWRWKDAPEAKVWIVELTGTSEGNRRVLFDAHCWQPYVDGYGEPPLPKTPKPPPVICSSMEDYILR